MSGICSSCHEDCEKVVIKDGFYYDYGSITNAWHDESYEGSSCCGEQVLKGKIFLDKSSYHISRKDHKNSDGKVFIRSGDLYCSEIRKGYYIDDDGRHAIHEYDKYLIMTKDELENGNWKFNPKSWSGKWECRKCSRKYTVKSEKCSFCESKEREAKSLVGAVEI